MNKLVYLVALCICISFVSGLDLLKAKETNEAAKGCVCVADWLGGLCFQTAGGTPCTSGKRGVDAEKCLCLTWNSNGVCIFCSGKK